MGLTSLCLLGTGLSANVDNSGDGVDNGGGLWTTCHKVVVNVHLDRVQRMGRPGQRWGLSQVPNEPPVDVLTGIPACPHGSLGVMMRVSGVIHTIHTSYDGNEFSL
jgi:hypothetical protein